MSSYDAIRATVAIFALVSIGTWCYIAFLEVKLRSMTKKLHETVRQQRDRIGELRKISHSRAALVDQTLASILVVVQRHQAKIKEVDEDITTLLQSGIDTSCRIDKMQDILRCAGEDCHED